MEDEQNKGMKLNDRTWEGWRDGEQWNNQRKRREGANKLLKASHVKDFDTTDSKEKGELKKLTK